MYTGCRITDMIPVAAELQSIRSGIPLHKFEQLLTSYRRFMAWEPREALQSFCPRPQLADVPLIPPAMGACYPFATGTSGPNYLTSGKQSVTRGMGEQ